MAGLLFVGTERGQVRGDDAGAQRDREAGLGGVREFLDHDLLEPQVGQAQSAVGGIGPRAEQVLLAREPPDVLADDPRALPVGLPRHDLALDKAAPRAPVRLVGVVEITVSDHGPTVGGRPGGPS
ncbi:hypothetical protein GCM10018775_35650 [Streptomyces umbrinus]|nr:hypothetical protein GCM10018775_35650 [Streptomyces umbrinus]